MPPAATDGLEMMVLNLKLSQTNRRRSKYHMISLIQGFPGSAGVIND